MKKAKGENAAARQVEKFKAAARELGCEGNEGRYDALLGEVAQQKPRPRVKKKAKK